MKKRRFSWFQITCIILVALLALGIVVQICVMHSIKNQQKEYNEKLDKLPEFESEFLMEHGDDFGYKIVINKV